MHDDAHPTLRREARSAGLRDAGAEAIDLADVNRRRTELWALAVTVVTALAVLASFAPDRLPWFAEAAPTWTLRVTLAMLSIVFVAYVFEKEVHLRRLGELLVEERVRHGIERLRVAQLTELDQLKSQFLSTVSHELKTPLTSIIGSASLLQRATLDAAERHEFLASIDRQARRLAQMVEQLLVAGRAHEETVDPTVTTDVAEVARVVAGDALLAGMEVEISAPVACVVRCDSGPLQQVLVNLVDNAHKHGAPPVCLEVAPRGKVTLVSVVDAGPGVPADARELVFERFHRLDEAGSRPGMGLGLPIVRSIVERWGGRVWIDPVPGSGAAVRFTLPTAGADAEMASGTLAHSGVPTGTSGSAGVEEPAPTS